MARSAKSFAVTYFLTCCFLMLGGSLVPGDSGLVAVFAWPGGGSAPEVVARFVASSAVARICARWNGVTLGSAL